MNISLALILHPTDGTLLIAQRKDGVHKAGFWEFPGGKCEEGETSEECAVRETREETGLKIIVLEAWPVMTHIYPERIVTLHPFLCRAQTSDAQPRDSRQVAWVLPEDLSRYAFPEANQPLLKRLNLKRLNLERLSNPGGFTG